MGEITRVQLGAEDVANYKELAEANKTRSAEGSGGNVMSSRVSHNGMNKVTRYQDPGVPEGFIELGGMIVREEQAIRDGLAVRTADGKLVAKSEIAKNAIRAQNATEAQSAKANDDAAMIYREHDEALTAMEEHLGSAENVAELTNAVIEGDEEAIEFVVENAPEIERGYRHEAQRIASQFGLTNVDLLNHLPEEDRQNCLRALITGQQSVFASYAARGVQIAAQVSADPELHAELRDAGVPVIAKGNGQYSIVLNGREVGLAQALMSGVVQWD